MNGRYEAQLHDALCESHELKGEQVYLGVYRSADRAARAYDLAALKFVGPEKATLNVRHRISHLTVAVVEQLVERLFSPLLRAEQSI